jgi:hypothetical protein
VLYSSCVICIDMTLTSFVDIISQDILENPVIAEDGITYSKKSILWWIKNCSERNAEVTSPKTGLPMGQSINISNGTSLDELADQLAPFRRCSAERPFEMHQPLLSIKVLANMFRQLHPRTNVYDGDVSWTPPTLIVLGERDSGKSALLEQLTMLSCFPLLSVPIRIQIRNAQTECSVSAVLDVCDTHTQQKICPTIVIPCMDQAYLYINEAAELLRADREDVNYTLSVSRSLILRVTSPYLPSIDILDLPGFSVTDWFCPANVSKLVSAHPHALYLAVVEAAVAADLANSPVLNLVNHFNLQVSHSHGSTA